MRMFLLMCLTTVSMMLSAQKTIIYKTVDTVKLRLKIYEPPGLDQNNRYPAIVFFFGGGWIKGSISQFERHAIYFAKKGLVCILADYRVQERNGTTCFEALKDAKSALRFIKQNAYQFSIDSSKIIAGGGSAGGQLAAATALIAGYNSPSDNMSISPRPKALVLFNPVIDNGPGGYGFDRVGEAYPQFSPLHNIRKGAPPTLIMLGKQDHLVPVATAEYYKSVMEKVGSRCDLILYDKAGHGFFNTNKNPDQPFFTLTLGEVERFLSSLGYISAH